MRRATVYTRKGRYFINAFARTTAGGWLATAPFLALDDTADEKSIGDAVMSALSQSHEGMPHPTEWKGIDKPLLDLAGVKSWGTFVKGAASCDVAEEGGVIEVVPAKNEGTWFSLKSGDPIRVRWSGRADELGQAVREALRMSSPR